MSEETPLLGSRVDPGATNMPNPPEGAPEGVQAATDALSGSFTWEQVEALAAQLEPEAFDSDQPALIGWRKRTQAEALAHAAKVIELGWRRVSVDDDTVERVARRLADFDGYIWPTEALRDGNSQSTPSSSKAGSSALRDGSGT